MTRPRLLTLVMGVAVLVLPLLLWVGIAGAHSFRSGDNITVPAGTTVDQTMFAAGRTIDIAGTVNGDIFCAGQTISISGVVNGDVMCAGQTVTVTGEVNGDVRLAGQTVTLSGPVTGNATMAGQSVSTDSRGTIGRDAELGGTDITVNGAVGRDLAVGGSNVTVNSEVGRDVRGGMEQLSLGSNAAIGGMIEYTSNNRLQRSDSATVDGQISYTKPKQQQTDRHFGNVVKFNAIFAAYSFTAAIVMGLILILLFPRLFHRASDAVMEHTGMTFLIGFVTSIAVPIMVTILFVSIIGIPLGLLALLAWIIAVMLSGFMSAYQVGRWLFSSSTNNVIWYMLLGVAILMVSYFIPIIGIFTLIAAYWFGLGMLVQQLRKLPRPAYECDKLEPAPLELATKKGRRR